MEQKKAKQGKEGTRGKRQSKRESGVSTARNGTPHQALQDASRNNMNVSGRETLVVQEEHVFPHEIKVILSIEETLVKDLMDQDIKGYSGDQRSEWCGTAHFVEKLGRVQ